MRRRYFVGILCPILLLLLIMNSGCGTTRSMINKVKKEKPSLKKKIMVFPPIDHSGLPSGRAARISEGLVELLKESSNLLFYDLPEDLSLPSEVKKPKFGVAYYHPEIAEMAKVRNMNALMAAHLPPIEKTKGRAGIWPFRYSAEIFKVTMIINVMDVTNGCLYLTEFVSEEVPLSLGKVESLKENEALNLALEKAIPAILKQQAAAVLKSLAHEPWTGRILDISKGVLKINAGEDVGLRPDQVFTVYTQGESVLCRTDRTVVSLGKKIGKIKTISIMDQHSLATPEEGGSFLAGQTVMFTPN